MNRLNSAQLVQRLSETPAPWALMLVGLPGSGKSTCVEALVKAGVTFDLLSTDKLIDAYAATVGKTYSEVFREVSFKVWNEQLDAETAASRAAKRNVIIDQTNVKLKSRRSKIGPFRADGYTCLVLKFDVAQEELLRRLEVRGRATGKHIPKTVIEDMTKSYLPPSKDEGWHHIWEYVQGAFVPALAG
jgi:predicted kinase